MHALHSAKLSNFHLYKVLSCLLALPEARRSPSPFRKPTLVSPPTIMALPGISPALGLKCSQCPPLLQSCSPSSHSQDGHVTSYVTSLTYTVSLPEMHHHLIL